jgi:hypothetical protein
MSDEPLPIMPKNRALSVAFSCWRVLRERLDRRTVSTPLSTTSAGLDHATFEFVSSNGDTFTVSVTHTKGPGLK